MSEDWRQRQPWATWNPARGVWDTPQTAMCGHSVPYSQTWPTSGWMRGGRVYARPTPAPPTAGSVSSSLPTPRATDGAKGGPNQTNGRGVRDSLPGLVTLLPTPVADHSRGLSQPGTDYASLPNVALSLLPTPTTQDGANTAGPSQYDRNSMPLNALAPLLPTPPPSDESMNDQLSMNWED